MRIQRAVCVFTCVPQRSDIDSLSTDVPAVWTSGLTLQAHGFIARVGNTLAIGQSTTMSCCVAGCQLAHATLHFAAAKNRECRRTHPSQLEWHRANS